MGVWQEFKQFASRGDFISMAVAFVIGLQVSAIVTALVSSVITPLIGTVFHANFSNVGAVTVLGSTFRFGVLLQAILTFLVVLAVLFFALVRPMEQLEARRHPPKPTPPPEPTRSCPSCYSTIHAKATRCAFCTSTVTPAVP
ncbi:Large-conductance mechanosensitive channel [mine drainage metagenome]|uniref:Large-conductance mechanosensitive channel n=1 Tax=mine drainage metagenome TaxID=410659 RepID=T1CT17_9ZZZZ